MADQNSQTPAADQAASETAASVATAGPKLPEDRGDLRDCCINTIKQHALFNPMMVCPECKQIIKCFRDDRSYRNYVTFCDSRRRPYAKGFVDQYYTVVFRSYETYR